MELNGEVVRILSSELYSNSAAIIAGYTEQEAALAHPVPALGGPYAAISFDPSTQFRSANLFFDDSLSPVPLVRGDIIKGTFNRVRVAPFERSIWITGTVSGLSLPNPPPVNNQVMVLRLWKKAPAQDRILLPDVMQCVQDLMVTPSQASIPAAVLYHLHAPGAKSIMFFASNHAASTANPAAITTYLSPARPEVPRTDPMPSNVTLYAGPTCSNNLAQVIITAPSDLNNPASKVVVDPGYSEYYVYNLAASGTAGPWTILVGVVVHFNNT